MEFKLVEGKEAGKRRQLYMKISRQESITFHKVKKKIFRWGKKYGPYGVVKQEEGSATFYKASKESVAIEIIKELDGNILPGLVEVNSTF